MRSQSDESTRRAPTVVLHDTSRQAVPDARHRLGTRGWQSIDRRAFQYETMPLRAMEWYLRTSIVEVDAADRQCFVDAPHSTGIWAYQKCQGWSGEGTDAYDDACVPTLAPPWEKQPLVVIKQARVDV